MRLLLLTLALLLTGCDSDSPSDDPPALSGTATYAVTFTSTWSAATHPTDFPADAHYSRLVGAVHPPNASLFEVGQPATEGIRLMAEKGQNDVLEVEVHAVGDEVGYLEGPRLAASPDTGTLTFTADAIFQNTAVTLVAMLAPSPDWFVGVSSLRLAEDGAWIEAATVDLVVYDAGTDGGASYTAANAPLDPREPIAVSDHPYFAGDRGVVGTLTFALVDVQLE